MCGRRQQAARRSIARPARAQATSPTEPVELSRSFCKNLLVLEIFELPGHIELLAHFATVAAGTAPLPPHRLQPAVLHQKYNADVPFERAG